MADPNTRQGKRTPVTLKIKFKSETLEQFIERYAVDVSQGGIFIRTKEPLAVGTQMKFEFQLRDASPLIAGEGTVVWTRENDPSRPAIAPGMGVRFDRLADGSQTVLERILAEKAKQAPGRGDANSGPTKPPLFTDTPTKVAPAPVQEALGVGRHRAKSDSSEQTPLPPPRPFHSDADDFDEKAFEEATKVRSLDELAAQTAGLIGGGSSEDAASDDAPTNTAIPAAPPDELAARRQGARPETALSDPPPPASSPTGERESAPGLPEPPQRASRQRLDSPTPRSLDESPGARAKIGLEPMKQATRDAAVASEVSSDLSHPTAPKRSSAASTIILLLVLVAGAGAAVWWFVLREKAVEQVAQDNPEGSGTGAIATDPGSASAGTGSDTAVPQVGSGTGSEGSAAVAVDTPPGPIVDTVIASSVAKGATVEIIGTDQKGPAPFTAKLEKDKAYKARVTAPGFLPTEVELKGGQEKTTAKLAAKPHVLTVTTEPAGADILIDSVNTQKITPSDVELTAAQAAKTRVRVTLRRPGFRPVDQYIAVKSFKDTDARMIASVTAKLTAVQRPTGGGTTGGGTTGGGTTGGGSTGGGTNVFAPAGGGAGAGSGSAATSPTGGGNGSATPPSGTGTGTGTGTGSATTPPSGAGTGSATGTDSTAKPPATTAPAGGAGSAATPSASNGEPTPAWTK